MSDETIPQEIRLSLAQALDVMETLRMAALWCGPKPDDWKPEKWPEDLREEFGVECASAFRSLLSEIERQMPDDTPTREDQV